MCGSGSASKKCATIKTLQQNLNGDRKRLQSIHIDILFLSVVLISGHPRSAYTYFAESMVLCLWAWVSVKLLGQIVACIDCQFTLSVWPKQAQQLLVTLSMDKKAM